MNPVGTAFPAMDVDEYVFAFVFLMAYSAAISRLAGPRVRGCAAIVAIAAAAGLAAFSDPWEEGVLVLAGAVVAVGGLSALAWLLCAAAESRAPVPAVDIELELIVDIELDMPPVAEPRMPVVAPRQTGVAST